MAKRVIWRSLRGNACYCPWFCGLGRQVVLEYIPMAARLLDGAGEEPPQSRLAVVAKVESV